MTSILERVQDSLRIAEKLDLRRAEVTVGDLRELLEVVYVAQATVDDGGGDGEPVELWGLRMALRDIEREEG